MALFSFGKSTPTPEPTPTPAAPAPAATPTPTPEGNPPEGLDKWAKLFDNKEGEGDPSTDEFTPFDPLATLQDDEAVNALLSKVDFRNSISEATQQKLANDDPNAMLDVINDVTKAAYLTALRHNQSMTQRVLQDQNRSFDKNVSSKISQSISDKELERALPEISNPVVAAGVKPFIQQLKSQNPNIAPETIVAEVRGYLQELNLAVNPTSKHKASGSQDEGTDWLDELGL